METTEEQKVIQAHSDLYRDITLWLQNNRHLPDDDRITAVTLALKEVDPARLLHYAACSFILADVRDDLNEANVDLLRATKSEHKAKRVTNIVTDTFVNVTMDYLKSLKKQRSTANSKRVEKFNTIKDDLKQHWQSNIPPTKKATEAAILLERSEMYKNATPKPKRSTLEKYVREWQAVQN